MRFIRKLSNTGSLRRCQGLAVPLEISRVWGFPRKIEIKFVDGVVTIVPLSADD